jgi:DsbC/DsbD-like thiol-disulfide interchange protein
MRILALAASALALALAAQSPAAIRDAASTHETKHLTVTTSATRRADGRVSLVASLTPKPTMHVYAPGQAGLIGVTITLEPSAGVKGGALKYPAPEKRVIAGETELVYSQPFRISDDVTLRKTAAVIKGTLRYQACDDVVCYLPTTVPLEWTVK